MTGSHPSFTPRKVYAHLHIPKCGGSTINHYLDNNFKCKFANLNSKFNNYQYDHLQISALLDGNPVLKCIGGHKLSIDLPWHDSNYHLTAFTWVRNPIQRFISHYFFHRFNTNWIKEAKILTLEDYAKWALADGHVHKYINGQTKFLAKADTIIPIKECIENHDFHLFCLPLLSQSIQILVDRYPKDFYGGISGKRNVSRKDQKASNRAIEIIEEYQQEDLKLYDMASKYTSEAIEKLCIHSNRMSPLRFIGDSIYQMLNYNKKFSTKIQKLL